LNQEQEGEIFILQIGSKVVKYVIFLEDEFYFSNDIALKRLDFILDEFPGLDKVVKVE